MPYFQTLPDKYARYGWQAADRGWLAQNFPIELSGGGNTAPSVAGRLEFAKVRLPVPSSVTNVVMNVQTVGNTLTANQNKAALFTPAGVLVGTTADQAAAWVSTGVKSMALASGPFACPAGDYFVGFWYNGTTSPAWLRLAQAGTTVVNIGSAAPTLFWGSADTGLTTTAPNPMGAQTATNTPWWVALS